MISPASCDRRCGEAARTVPSCRRRGSASRQIARNAPLLQLNSRVLTRTSGTLPPPRVRRSQ
ncbi:hypothetical protein SNL152K_2877 [Streptomyces sp. NL15-2K]|nr:hypothetical protein SNL152K_2877 [Streptomyces sp. NL15-2K]